MAHISLSPSVAATKFSPIEKSFDRASKEGDIPQVNFLLGSQYNIAIGGEVSITEVGNIAGGSSVTVNNGKLEITGESSDGTEIEKVASFTSFMYFYQGVKIVGENEIVDADVGPPALPVQRMRYEIEDLSTGDKLRFDLEGGDGQAVFNVKEVVDGTESTLVSENLTVGTINVKWELDFLDNGLTKIYFKEPTGERIRVYEGRLNADLGECKVSARLVSTQQTPKTVKSDFIWIYYPNLFVGYSVALADRLNGRVRIFDTNNTETESDWTEVFSSDHPFVGERVIENGIIRLRIKPTPKVEVYGWNLTTLVWELTGSIIPKDSNGNVATSLKDVIIERFNDIHVKAIARFGITNYFFNVRRGQPITRIFTDSKTFRINTNKARFGLSVATPSTQILHFNQEKCDDAGEGNPLQSNVNENPFIFTNDTDIDNGIQLVNDNWYTYFTNGGHPQVIGFVGVTKRPTGLQVDAVSATELNNIDFTFDVNSVLCVGVLNTVIATKIGNSPAALAIGDTDTYVKWRSNEGIFGFDQRGFLKRKR